MRRSNIRVRLPITSFKFRARFSMVCLRLNVSNRRVNSAARNRAIDDLAEMLACRVLGASGKGHLGIALYHHKQVIEIMGDAARQLPHRLHFLGLAQLLLQSEPIGHVFGGPHHPVYGASRIPNRKGPIAHPANGTVGTNDSIGVIELSRPLV